MNSESEVFREQASLLEAAADGMEIHYRLRGLNSSYLKFIIKPYPESFNFDRYVYQVAEITADDIDWSRVNPEFQYVCVNEHGSASAFVAKPHYDDYKSRWSSEVGEREQLLDCYHKYGGDWAIFRRPQGKDHPGSLTEYHSINGIGYMVKFTRSQDDTWYAQASFVDGTPVKVNIDVSNPTARGTTVKEALEALKKELTEEHEKKVAADNAPVCGTVRLFDHLQYEAKAEKVASGIKWLAYFDPPLGVGVSPSYGANPEEAFEALRRNGNEAVKKYYDEANKTIPSDLNKLYEWFCDFDEDKPTIEMCISRLEEMRTAEVMLRDFIYLYEKKQPFLYQHYFPETKE